MITLEDIIRDSNALLQLIPGDGSFASLEDWRQHERGRREKEKGEYFEALGEVVERHPVGGVHPRCWLGGDADADDS